MTGPARVGHHARILAAVRGVLEPSASLHRAVVPQVLPSRDVLPTVLGGLSDVLPPSHAVDATSTVASGVGGVGPDLVAASSSSRRTPPRRSAWGR